MSVVPLSDDENVVVFVRPTLSDLEGLDGGEREQFLKRLLRTLESDAPDHYVEKAFSNCDELQQFRAGRYLRGYCRLVMGVAGYNVLFLFHVTKHNYRQLDLYDARACKRVSELTDLSSVGDVEEYLDAHDAMTVEDVRDVLDNLQR